MINHSLNKKPKNITGALYAGAVIITMIVSVLWAVVMFLSAKQSAEFDVNMNHLYNLAVGLIFPELIKNGGFFSVEVSSLLSLTIIYGGFSLCLWALNRLRYLSSAAVLEEVKKESGVKLIKSAALVFVLTSLYGLFLHAINYFINVSATSVVLVRWAMGSAVSLLTVAGSLAFCKLMRKYPKIINKETILYLIFGVLTTLVNVVSFNLLRAYAPLGLFGSNAVAWALAVIFAFVVNKVFVFESKANGFSEILKEASLFIGARLVSLAVDMLLIGLFVKIIGLGDGLSKVLVNIVVMIMNYIFSKLFIFKNEK